MKQFKVLGALLAVAFCVGSLVTPAKANHKFVQSFFSYVSGDLTNPNSWRINSVDPQCPASTTLCGIVVTKSGTKPDNTALDALYTESSGFTVAGTYAHGKVEKKD